MYTPLQLSAEKMVENSASSFLQHSVEPPSLMNRWGDGLVDLTRGIYLGKTHSKSVPRSIILLATVVAAVAIVYLVSRCSVRLGLKGGGSSRRLAEEVGSGRPQILLEACCRRSRCFCWCCGHCFCCCHNTEQDVGIFLVSQKSWRLVCYPCVTFSAGAPMAKPVGPLHFNQFSNRIRRA